MRTPNIKLKHFRAEGCLSYLLYDATSGEAIVIDPIADLEEGYAQYCEQRKLKVVLALDTHIHADHFSATHFFREKFGAEIAMSAKSPSRRATKKLRQGDKLRAGGIELTVFETPGHTPDSLSFHGHGLVFTGDTLFIGSSGRTDFPGADPGQQWESLHRVLGGLPGETVVLPGHDYSGMLFSTLAWEKQKNPHWKIESKQAFTAFKLAEIIATDTAEIQRRVSFNSDPNPGPAPAGAGCATACGAPMKETSRMAQVGVKQYQERLQKASDNELFIDVRDTEEFQSGHIPGTLNMPLSELGWFLGELPASKKLFVSCLGGGRSTTAAKTLGYLGYADVTNVEGGFRAWVAEGWPVAK